MNTNVNTTVPTTVKWNEYEIDMTALPPVSVFAMFRRGISHYLGNEAATKVSDFKAVAEGQPAKTDAEVAEFKATTIKTMLEALVAGTVGVSTRGPRGTAVDTIMRTIAVREIRGVLKGIGLSMPSGHKVVTFPDGSTRTAEQMISKRLADHAERLRREADAQIKADERKAAKAKAEAGDGTMGADKLGL